MTSATMCKPYAVRPTLAPGGMRFYVGVHQPNWLALASTPLFVSDKRLERRKTFPRAVVPWALDSGAFSQLFLHTDWPNFAEERYVAHVQRYVQEIGRMEWAAPQDWMCEPFMLKKTGLALAEHQRRTVANYLTLRGLDSSLPFIPVLQGYTRDDYLRCIDLYAAHGVNLEACTRVGIGTVCRRQGTREAEYIVRSVRAALPGARLHAFGAKISGLPRYGDCLTSADSMAWSYDARRKPPMPGHTHTNCANCLPFAEAWAARVVRLSTVTQPPLFLEDVPYSAEDAEGIGA